MAKSKNRPTVVFPLRKLLKLANFIEKVKTIVSNMQKRTDLFPSPSPGLTLVLQHIDALDKAQTKALTRVIGSATNRNVKYDQVLKDIRALKSYVQHLADESEDGNAFVIIKAAGFDIRERASRTKSPLSARNMNADGVVKLIAKSAGKRASYNWRYRLLNTTVWINLPPTLQATTLVHGLKSGAQLEFSVSSVTKDGVSDWSQPVKCVVK